MLTEIYTYTNGDISHSLMICFTARHVSGAVKADGVEIADAQWFSRDNLPTLPRPGTTARRLIERWLEGGSS